MMNDAAAPSWPPPPLAQPPTTGRPGPLGRIFDARSWFAWAFVGATLTGCAGNLAEPEEATTAAVTPEAATPLTAQEASVDVRPVAIFRSAPDRSRSMRIERGRPGSEGRWTVKRETASSTEGPWIAQVEQVMVLNSSGEVALSEEINHEERVELVFDPPMVVMPARLAPGQAGAVEQTGELRVYPIGNRRKTKAQGPFRQRIEHQGAERVELGLGEGNTVVAQHVVHQFTASLPPAEVSNRTDQWIIPRIGLVAETRQERTRVFGVPTRNNLESWTAEPPVGAPFP